MIEQAHGEQAGGQDAVVAEQGLLDSAQPQPGTAAQIRNGKTATGTGVQLTVAIDEPGRAGAGDEDGPLLAAKGTEAGTEGIGGEPDAGKGKGHFEHGVIALRQPGGGKRQPDSHSLL